MKKISIILLLLILASYSADAYEHYVDYGGGANMDFGILDAGGKEKRDDGWSGGMDTSITVFVNFNSYLGLETGAHSYGFSSTNKTELFTPVDAKVSVSSVGFIILGRLYRNIGNFRVHTSAGGGIYYNELTPITNYDNDFTVTDLSFGGIVKAGIDYTFYDGYFIGLNVKGIFDRKEFTVSKSKGQAIDIDLSGVVYSLSIGRNF